MPLYPALIDLLIQLPTGLSYLKFRYLNGQLETREGPLVTLFSIKRDGNNNSEITEIYICIYIWYVCVILNILCNFDYKIQ